MAVEGLAVVAAGYRSLVADVVDVTAAAIGVFVVATALAPAYVWAFRSGDF